MSYILKKYKYKKKFKPIQKPNLILAMKKIYLEFAIRYKNYTIEDWK